MDLFNWTQLISVLTILLFIVVEEGDSFLAAGKHGVRSLKKAAHQHKSPRHTGLQNAFEEIRERKNAKHLEKLLHNRSANKKHLRKNAADVDRVSYKECNITPDTRADCGYDGITEDGCATRECCFDASNEPTCYHSLPTINDKCLLDADAREQCGWAGLRKEQCLALSCCWQPNSADDVPWCFAARVLPIFEGECGVPAVTPSISLDGARVVGGEEAIPHSFPWMASLHLDNDHFCGGSLINDKWIVTAAHCAPVFNWGSSKSVVLGMHSQSSSESTKVVAQIDRVISHESYGSANGMDNDIALIKLTEPVDLSDAISPVCLPDMGEQVEPGKRCYTTGWGHTTHGGYAPDTLMQVMVPIVETEECNEGDWYGGSVDETMICAGYEEGGRDSCQGDSGGPLFCEDDDTWELVGVVSWGHGCASERKPGIYSRVSVYIDWIREQINLYS